MNENEFSNIFIRPLYKDKFPLSEIDKNIYDEVLDLSDRFCLPSQILNNLIYDNETSNSLIDGLIKQTHVANLKKLINQNELLKIANLFNENSIDYVFMKGSAINVLSDGYVRYSRDLDVLVCKHSLLKAYELLKNIGYGYLSPLVADTAKFTSQTHHIPILSNGEGALVEIHHRVTSKSAYKECPFAESMLKEKLIITKNNVNIRISNVNHTIAHIIYHAVKHHKFDLGPVFLHDIKHLKEQDKDEIQLNRLLTRLCLKDQYRKIVNFIDKKNVDDIFEIYKIQQIKIYNERNPKKISYLVFSQKGRSDLWNITKRFFIFNEDYFQTSKYSFKFYLILLIIIKRHIVRLLKN